jgi:hypothetical protein
MSGGWSPDRDENFSLHYRVQTGSGAHPASYPVGTRGPFLGIKAVGREADHSPPSSAEVKNAWNSITTPPIRLLYHHSPNTPPRRGAELKKKEAHGNLTLYQLRSYWTPCFKYVLINIYATTLMFTPVVILYTLFQNFKIFAEVRRIKAKNSCTRLNKI